MLSQPSVSSRPSIPAIHNRPIVGNLPEFRRDRLALFMDVARTCGDIGAYHMGWRKVFLINSAELVQEVLVEQADYFEKTPTFRAFARPVLGNGLLTCSNELHKQERKLLNPPLQPRHISRYAEIMATYANQLQEEWSHGQEVNVAREMVRLTLWIVGKTFFDADVLNEADELGGALTEAIHGFNAQASSLIPLTIEWPTPTNLRYRKAVNRLNRTVYKMIAERRASGVDHGDLLSMLLKARYDDGSPMTDVQIRDEAMNMFMPGHETTATGLTWTWYLLSQHPEVYERLQAEVDQVLQGRTPTFGDLPNLPYALQVFKEALRLYPPVYMFTRQATRDTTLGGHHLPAGSFLIFSPYSIHRRPDYFPDPDTFNPDRFAPGNESQVPKYAYMPFGAGPRICIGNHYALLSGHMIITTLTQHITFTFVEGQRIETAPMVTLRPRNGMCMYVNRRNVPASNT